MKELKDTSALMESEDYRERFIAEYLQTKIRYEKLKAFIERCKADSGVKHDCPLRLLERQLGYMSLYLDTLYTRSAYEGIDLEEYE